MWRTPVFTTSNISPALQREELGFAPAFRAGHASAIRADQERSREHCVCFVDLTIRSKFAQARIIGASSLIEAYQGALHVGSPETVARKIASTVETLGASRFDMKYSAGTLPHVTMMRSIELYGTEVAPRARELLTSQTVAVGGA